MTWSGAGAWRVEEAFEQAKGEVGLDHYQVRHIGLVPAHHPGHGGLAFLAATRARLPDAADGLGGRSW